MARATSCSKHYMVMNYHEFAINYAMDDIHNNIINVNE